MGAEDFLKMKRAEKGNRGRYGMATIAPSPAVRHGLDMGAQNTESGQYTGNGPDGVVQPQLPTQRRQDANGRPYMVDEGELLVIDNKTLNAYGGAEALDSFIQRNMPAGENQQMACGGVPHQKGPVSGGSGMNMAQGTNNFRQYSSGGVPTRPRMFAGSEQLKMLEEVRNGVEQYQEGGTPRQRTVDQISPANVKTPGLNGIMPGNKGIEKITPQRPRPNNLNIGPIAKDPKPGNTVAPLIGPQSTAQPQQWTTPLGTQTTPLQGPSSIQPENFVTPIQGPTSIQPDDIQPTPQPTQPAEPGKAPVTSPSQYDEMMLDRYLKRQGAMSESERAAEAQRGMQAGLSDREVMGKGAISDVSRRAAMGDTTAQFAIDAAKRQEERDKFQQGMSLQEKQMQLSMDKFDYGKQMDSVSMLIAQGGADNFQKASDIMTGMFGNSVDFSNALQSENLSNFNTGFNNMNSAIAAGTSFEDWVKTAQADGTLEGMNMTEGDLKTMYKNAKLQSDPVYQAVSMVDSWVENGLIDADQADDLKAIMAHQMANPEGFKVEDGYQVTDENGNEVGFFKTEAELEKFMAENKDKGYTSAPVENHVGLGGPTPSGDPSTSPEEGEGGTVKEQFENFMDSHAPEEYQDKITYEDWVKAGKPKNWEEYKENSDLGLSDFAKTLREKYTNEGWPPPEFNEYTKKHHKDAESVLNAARENFVSGNNTYSMKKGDLDKYETVAQLMKDDAIKKGNVITIDGHSNPLVVYKMSSTEGGIPTGGGVTLYDMVTGEAIVWRDYNGELTTGL